ncbi:hypothetical protein FRC06_000380 [Ceratobasidium sp. 370]|nr:hypothetical protein FRC06_000380 [Ceratobasidium sp. 370]
MPYTQPQPEAPPVPAAATPVTGRIPVKPAQPAVQMITDYNEVGKARDEPRVETGVLVDRRENMDQKANGTRIKAETVKVSWTQSEREVVHAMPALASAEVRYDADFVAENPVRQALVLSRLRSGLRLEEQMRGGCGGMERLQLHLCMIQLSCRNKSMA